MPSKSQSPADIDTYIADFPANIQEILQTIRATIQKAAPKAQETIKYGMPTYITEDGNVVYFAAFKKHIGLFPPIAGDDTLKQKTAKYLGEKGNLKFPLDEPMPYPLISKLVKQRLKEMKAQVAAKAQKR